MQKPNCQIISFSDFQHLQQIYTGFFLLYKQGRINLSQQIKQIPLRKFEELHIKVIINNEITLYYDMHDCGNIEPAFLEGVDFYFKRSYSPKLIENLEGREKVFPFGLNYENYAGNFDRFLLARSKFYQGKEKLKIVLKAFGGASGFNIFEDLPRPQIEPKVIFMARAWNPEKIEDKKQKTQTEAINETRAECVRLLRKEFGARFFGGLAVDDYSQTKFKDCLLPNAGVSKQSEYLKILKTFPICIATTGLCGSNGWKIAEYVALAKAIVSEKLHYEVTGDFEENKNYLNFETPAQCVEKVVRLFEDNELRRQIMENNRHYYLNFMRPDKIILNTLQIAAINGLGNEKIISKHSENLPHF